MDDHTLFLIRNDKNLRQKQQKTHDLTCTLIFM